MGPSGRRKGVPGLLGFVWPLLGHGRSPGTRLAVVGTWPVPWVPSGRRRGVATSLGPSGSRGGVAGPLSPVWPLWGRSQSPGTCLAAVGAWTVTCNPCMAAVGAWLVPWTPSFRVGA